MNKTDLTVWLRDFPKCALDLQEMRRSAAQHMPEVDIAMHAAFLIEERFKRNYDEDVPMVAGSNHERTEAEIEEEQARLTKIREQEFTQDQRFSAYKELLSIHKYA